LVTGIESNGEVARCKKLLCDPSYVMGTDKIKKTGQVAKVICIMAHPIPSTNGESAQIIIPASEVKRQNDIYISTVSYHHKIAAAGKYVCVCSTTVETKEPEKELLPAINLLGAIEQKFFWVSDSYEPTGDGSKDQLYVTSTYDATSHFESATREAVALYERMSGQKIDLTISAEPDDLEEKGETPSASASAVAAPSPEQAAKDEEIRKQLEALGTDDDDKAGAKVEKKEGDKP